MRQLKTSSFIAFVILVALALSSLLAFAETDHHQIKLNQLGYLPSAAKVAIVADTSSNSVASDGPDKFYIIDLDTGKTAFTGTLSNSQRWPYSDEMVRKADFSALTEKGNYSVALQASDQSLNHREKNQASSSFPFEISDTPFERVHQAAIKAFYYNRSGTAIDPLTGGSHARAAGHGDTRMKVHKSAATNKRPEGTLLSSPRGWYDAGDYGKYVVNSGISTYTLLSAYRHYSDYYRGLNLNIVESGNNVPDLLDEIKWNLDWLETMQDLDGGVYHKLTALGFSSMDDQPSEEDSQRYVIGKSVTAALNFAAVLANASTVMADFEDQFPGVADGYKNKAIKAYQWAKQNPDAYYHQPDDVSTGAYGDKNASDEFAWAAAELFIATGEKHYYHEFLAQQVSPSQDLSWSSVSALPYISLLSSAKGLLSDQQYTELSNKLLATADQHYAIYDTSAYGVSVSEADFVWGSNSAVLNNGLVLIQAYRLSNDDKYLEAAMSTLDYVLGKNATGYSFVTGYGDKTPVNIHHRPSTSDDNDVPVPGFLVGGPHSGKQDKCSYEGRFAATTYADTVCSYSTNEIAINWNAPLVYMLAAAINLQ